MNIVRLLWKAFWNASKKRCKIIKSVFLCERRSFKIVSKRPVTPAGVKISCTADLRLAKNCFKRGEKKEFDLNNPQI